MNLKLIFILHLYSLQYEYIYMYTHANIYVYIFVYIHIYIDVTTCIRTRIYACTFMHKYTHIYNIRAEFREDSTGYVRFTG
jgi:hypothetical protein